MSENTNSKVSINNRIIVEAYKKDGLKSVVSNGFAMVEQKVTVKGLKLLLDARIIEGSNINIIPKGSVAYIREEYLHSAPWAQKILQCTDVGEDFIVVDYNFVEFVKYP